MLESVLHNFYNVLDHIVITIETLFDANNNFCLPGTPKNFTNSLYDIYYHISLLIANNTINGMILGPFNYPDSFNIYVENTNFSINVHSVEKDNNYTVYTAIMKQDDAIKIPELGYRDVYKEQCNNENIITDIIITKQYICDSLM